MDSSGSGWRQVAGSIEYVNEYSGSSKAGISSAGSATITLSRRTLLQAVLKHHWYRISSSEFPVVSAWLILRSWRWRRYLPPKKRRFMSELHEVTTQKKELLIITTASSFISCITCRGYVSGGRIMRKRNLHFKSHLRVISPLNVVMFTCVFSDVHSSCCISKRLRFKVYVDLII
jgi:hypothetical protein